MEIPAFCSKYYPWFVELGYPQLDINEFKDGEWAIIQLHNSPLVPSLTKWNYMLKGMRHVEINRGFIEKFVKSLDPTRAEFWEREERMSQSVADEADDREKHAQEFAAMATRAITRNPDLMERIARNGMKEAMLNKIGNHLEPWQARGFGGKVV